MNTDERRATAILADYQELIMCGEDKCATCLYTTGIFARAVRASDEAAGMVLVPRKPTAKMIDAGNEHVDSGAAWAAMLAAGGDDADV